MASIVDIKRWTGNSISPTKSTITGINTRANAYDGHSTNDTLNPITIVSNETHYSYWVSTRLFATTSPTGTIDNIRWYTDGSNNFGNGINCVVQSANSYVQATGSTGTGLQLTTTNHTGLTASPVNAFSFTSSNPLILTGNLSNPNTGDFGQFVIYQLIVSSSAYSGTTSSETFTWKYDET